MAMVGMVRGMGMLRRSMGMRMVMMIVMVTMGMMMRKPRIRMRMKLRISTCIMTGDHRMRRWSGDEEVI